jgi:hypothetical protein
LAVCFAVTRSHPEGSIRLGERDCGSSVMA